MVWWESFAVTDLKKKEWRVSWKCEKIARDRVWESWSAGSVSFPRSASVLNFEVKIHSAEVLNCIDQVVALNTFGTSTFNNSWNPTSRAQRTVYLFWMALYLNPSLHTKYGQTNPLHYFITDSYSPLLYCTTLKSYISGNCDFFQLWNDHCCNLVWIEHLLCTTLKVQSQSNYFAIHLKCNSSNNSLHWSNAWHKYTSFQVQPFFKYSQCNSGHALSAPLCHCNSSHACNAAQMNNCQKMRWGISDLRHPALGQAGQELQS